MTCWFKSSLSFAAAFVNNTSQSVITTIAGTAGTAGYSGDGGAATNAKLSSPIGVAVDALGGENVYIVDVDNSIIRVVNSAGIITTFAGTAGTAGYSGDGGMAINAQLKVPYGVAVDGLGEKVYIAEYGNGIVRVVNSAGIISTFAGTGTHGYSGDNGAAVNAQLVGPTAVAVDVHGGNVYIIDYDNNRVRVVNSAGIISTFAGTGTQGYNGDGVAATNAKLSSPIGVAVDTLGDGNVYIADFGNARVRVVNSAGIITTFAGTGTAGYSGDGGMAINAHLNSPIGVAVDARGVNVYIADTNNRIVFVVNSAGIITSFAGNYNNNGLSLGDGGQATYAYLNNPRGVTVDSKGNVYIADTGDNRIRKVSSTLNYPTGQPTSHPSGPTRHPTPNPSPYPSHVIDTSQLYHTITTIAGTGSYGNSGDGGPATSAQLTQAYGVSVDVSNNVYFPDYQNNKVRMVTSTGIIITIAGTGSYGSSGDDGAATSAQLNNPVGVANDMHGNLYIADATNNKIRIVSSTGIITTIAGTGMWGSNGDDGAATSAQLNNPQAIAIDISGKLYIGDISNFKVRLVSTTGIITTFAGTGTYGNFGDGVAATLAQLSFPVGLFVDNGNVYIADLNNHMIRVVSSTGTITTVAGTGTAGNLGDGEAATSAQLNTPRAMIVDGMGNLYIADTNNNKVRMVAYGTGIIMTVVNVGGSTTGPIGDGGPATSATLNYPCGVANDLYGNLYIADTGDYLLRKVSSTANYPTGQPSQQPLSRPSPHPTPNPSPYPSHVIDTSQLYHTITTIAGTAYTPGYSGDNGAATSATFNYPYAVAVDSSANVYVADTDSEVVRLVTRAGIITTVAGSNCGFYDDSHCVLGDNGAATSAHLRHPRGVALDASDQLYIVEGDNDFGRVRLVTTSGIITTFAGIGYSYSGGIGDGGPATSARLNYPHAIAIDISGGKFYIADSNNYLIRVVSSGIITTFAGTTGTAGSSGDYGQAISALLNYPVGIAVDTSGTLYIAENKMSYQKVRVVSSTGIITTFAGTGTAGSIGDDGAATSAELSYCAGLAVDSSYNLYIADSMNNKIRLVTHTTGIITTFAGGSSDYGSLGNVGPATSAFLFSPSGVATDSSANVYIATDYIVRKVSSTLNYPTGQPTTRPSGPTRHPTLQPSGQPSLQPSTLPTTRPSMLPSNQPSGEPTKFVWHPKPQVCLLYCMP